MKSVSLKKIIVLYLFFILLYGIVASLFTSTVHTDVDEELYLSMARSFFYEGRFAVGDSILNYSCTLYSMLISLAYFFYEPESILTVMRLIGVVTMTSAIFPIWLLSEKLLGDKKISLYITVFSMFFPFMFDTAYLMQEVLSYPLFLWAILFLLYALEGDKPCHFVLSALFSVLCFFTKTYLFFIPVVINLVQGLEIISVRKKSINTKKLKGILAYDITYVIAFAALYVFPYILHGFEKGSNHYSSQFSKLFPITGFTIACAVSCCILYAAFFIVNTGMIPFAALIKKQKEASGFEKKFWSFILISAMFLILEIVVMIVLTEEGNVLMPRKYLFRYFHIFSVPMLLALLSVERQEKEWMSKAQMVMICAAGGIAILYWLIMCGKTRHGIIDGHFFVALENMNRVVPYAAVVALALFIAAILFVRKRKKLYKVLALAAVAGFWILNAVQLPYYTNVVADGKNIEQDAIRIAEYANENEVSAIYFVKRDSANPYLQNCYGYFTQPFIVIGEEQIGEYADKENSIIVTTDAEGKKLFLYGESNGR